MNNSQITPINNQLSNIDMMEKIANDQQELADIQLLTSNRVTDQLKVFLISQARNELTRVLKLTRFLDRLENNFINKVDDAMVNNNLTLRQYNEIITMITNLLSKSNEIITSILKDDSLTMILNTTVYNDTSNNQSYSTSVVSQLKDAQSREKVRMVIQQVLEKTKHYETTDAFYDKTTQEEEETRSNNGNN